ncbi:MAG: DUF3618 domain-containing protein [Acidimicrobiia bacterium]
MGQDADQLKRDIDQTRGNLTSTVDAIGDRVSPGRIVERKTERMRQGVQSVRDRVMGAASDVTGTVGDRVSGAATSVRDSAGSAAGSLKEAPASVKQAATERTEGAPLAVGLIAFGAGLLASALVKPTAREAQLAQAAADAAQPVKESLAEAGRELASDLREQGQAAVEEVKHTATQGAEDVKDTARQASEQAVDAGRQATSDVRETVQAG